MAIEKLKILQTNFRSKKLLMMVRRPFNTTVLSMPCDGEASMNRQPRAGVGLRRVYVRRDDGRREAYWVMCFNGNEESEHKTGCDCVRSDIYIPIFSGFFFHAALCKRARDALSDVHKHTRIPIPSQSEMRRSSASLWKKAEKCFAYKNGKSAD